ncbi:TatD family hydrolase [Micropruina sp.]|uniref:TatD family hydrolase n=1 Tax=Micropruina sp. TaxID=2737536 RepID=UPI0039E6711A
MSRELPEAPPPLPAPTTDAHTHLLSTQDFSGLPVPEAIARARAVGVHRLVEVGCDVPSSRAAVEIARAHSAVIACVALHPNDAARAGADLPNQLDAIAALVRAGGVRGIGETGLDYYRTRDDQGKRLQRQSFAAHLALAAEHDLAVVIHDRDAHADVLDVLDTEGVPRRFMMHCFSGDADFARQCLDRGAWLSFPGTVTFKPNHALREAFDLTPDDRLLVETDAPYLTPVPLRGRPNASYLLPLTVRFLAERRGADLAGFCRLLDANASALFGDWGACGDGGRGDG